MSTRAAVIAGLAATVLATVSVAAHAQQRASIAIVAARHDTLALDSSSAVTAVFRIHNGGRDTADVTPALALPRGWEPLMRTAPMRIAPNGTELWLAGVHAPSNAAAGNYVLRASASANGLAAADPVVVHVRELHSIEAIALDAPGWILSGGAYDARFLVRNRGNVTENIALSASSSRGVRATVDMPVVSLAPGATSTVQVRIGASSVGSKAQDDLLELVAQDQRDSHVRVTASSRTTLVPKNGGMADNLATIPSMLTVRATQPGSGVSYATVTGRGIIPGSKTTIDYSGFIPSGGLSPFGDRDEMHVAIHNDKFGVRLGDGVFGYSELTSNGALGFGGQVDATHGAINTGAYVEHSRWTNDGPTEAGFRVGTPRDIPSNIGLTAVARETNGNSAGVISLGGTMPIAKNMLLSVEGATSDSAGAVSAAERTHLTGTAGRVSYDLVNQYSGLAYAASVRGTRGTDASIALPATRDLSFHAYAGMHTSGPTAPTSNTPSDSYTSGSAGVSYGSWGSVDYAWTGRRDQGDSVFFDGTQRSIRATTFIPLGPASLSLNADHGFAAERTTNIARAYTTFGGSFNVHLPNNGSVSFFGQHSDGNALGGDGKPTNTGGAIANVALGRRLQMTLASSVSTMARFGLAQGAPVMFGQADARVDYKLPSETTVGVRAHYWINPTMQGSRDNSAVYFEVRRPLALPIGRQRRLGRVEGRVADANGKPLEGVLVHVGDQVAVTDRKGEVSMFGLSSGTHMISLDGSGAAAQTMLVGDATVTVDGKSNRPSTFSVAMARGAKLRTQVSVLDFATTGGDSLVEVGKMNNVTVALQGTRDTLYQTSDDRGQINFGAIAPGHWTIAVLPGTELPDHHAFQAERVDLTLAAGDAREVELKIVPRKRTVTFVGGEVIKVKQEQPKPDNPQAKQKN